jgi:hypothetical protein
VVISFKDKALEQILASRKSEVLSPSQIARRDLDRYYWLLTQSEPINLSFLELGVIADTLEQHPISASWQIKQLSGTLLNAIVFNRVDENWGVPEETIMQKVRGFSPLQLAAVVDQAEQFGGRKKTI